MYRKPITIQDVLGSRPVVYPFNLLNICLVTDAGGAVVLTRADRARDCAKKPVYVRGTGEATEHVSLTQMQRLTFSEATRMSGDARLRHGRRQPRGLRSHHAVRRVHLGAADHARVARASPSRARACILRGGTLDARRLAADQHQRRRAVLHAHRDVRHLPDHRGRPSAAWRVRRPPGARTRGSRSSMAWAACCRRPAPWCCRAIDSGLHSLTETNRSDPHRA